jgi:hypothetical protein
VHLNDKVKELQLIGNPKYLYNMKRKTFYIQRMTEEQKAIMMSRYADTRTAELAQQMGVSYRTVCRFAVALGLTKSAEFRRTASKTGSRKRVERYGPGFKCKTFFDGDKRSYMQQHFSETPTSVLAITLGVNDRTIRRWAKSLGLTKNHEAMEAYRIKLFRKSRIVSQHCNMAD